MADFLKAYPNITYETYMFKLSLPMISLMSRDFTRPKSLTEDQAKRYTRLTAPVIEPENLFAGIIAKQKQMEALEQQKRIRAQRAKVICELLEKCIGFQIYDDVLAKVENQADRVTRTHIAKTLVEKNVDQNQLQTTFLEEAINQMYGVAVTEKKLRPVSNPEISIKSFVD